MTKFDRLYHVNRQRRIDGLSEFKSHDEYEEFKKQKKTKSKVKAELNTKIAKGVYKKRNKFIVELEKQINLEKNEEKNEEEIIDGIKINKNEINKLREQIYIVSRDYGITTTRLLGHQQELMDVAINRAQIVFNNSQIYVPKYKYVVFQAGNGSGKCHKKGDKILMYNGEFEEVQNIKIGDKLMGPDSEQRTVTNLGGGTGMIYKITPESGEPIFVNGEHQLYLIHRRRKENGDRYVNGLDYAPEGRFVQISVDDYLKKSNKWKAEAYMWKPNIINYSKKDLIIPPYFLGLWLGDGNSHNTGITNIDNEIINYIYEYGYKEGLEVSNRGILYNIISKIGKPINNKLKDNLRKIGVLNNKHIPLNYLTSNEEDRLELLAGLIDTDGSLGKTTPRYEITQKNEILARNILQLGRSLGFRCSIVETTKKCYNNGVSGKYYRVSINGDVWRIPVKVNRKKAVKKDRYNNKNWLVTKFKIEEDGIDDFYGFTLDGDSLYLDYNFNVQHNSFWLYYMISRYAIGRKAEKYKLDFIGEKKNIFIVTQSGSNVRDYVEKYLLGDFSPCRIPPDLIEKITRGSDHIKEIKLKNGCIITIKTVEQGQKRLVGGNPDLLVIDEPIENDEVWGELLARLRSPKAQMLYGFTPVNGYNASYYFLYEQQDEIIRKKTYIGKYSSLLNITQDHSTLNAFSENERAVRIYGEFMPKSGLVYNEFNRYNNVIPKMQIKHLGKCRFFAGLDVGVMHPTGFVAIAIDTDGRHIVFDEFKESRLLVSDIAKKIKAIQRKHGIIFEKIIIDSAGQREKLELKEYGIICENARKHDKGDNGEKNRRAGIMRVNQLFNIQNLLIMDNCVSLIKELGVHAYKDNGTKDGDVKKENDDVIDAMRYALFFLKPPKQEVKPVFIENFNKKYSKYGLQYYKKGKIKNEAEDI